MSRQNVPHLKWNANPTQKPNRNKSLLVFQALVSQLRASVLFDICGQQFILSFCSAAIISALNSNGPFEIKYKREDIGEFMQFGGKYYIVAAKRQIGFAEGLWFCKYDN